ncbi:MAG: hypothetical protein HQ515_10805 [Phycisphaeraceae bacterium]|nr:hypothetical protein [Phycisphaeraceae bacterium]
MTNDFGAWGTSEIELTGGKIKYFEAGGSSLTTFYGYGWSASEGLSIVGDEVVGVGTLDGVWPDGTAWTTEIGWNADTAVIRLASTQTGCGECRGKVSELTLRYTGTDTAVVKVEQKGKKGKKDERGLGDSDGSVVFEEALDQGDPFTFTGLDDKGTLGTEISVFINNALNTKIHTSCSKPIYPGMISGLFEVVEGHSLEGGLICPLDTELPDESCECRGKVTQLTLLYTGASTEPIVVTGKAKKEKKGKKKKKEKEKKGSGIGDAPIIFFEDSVNDIVATTPDGRVFTINGQDDKGTLGTEITLYVGGVLNTTIHTSCSKPIGVGLTFGDFEVLEGDSREGGPLCVFE